MASAETPRINSFKQNTKLNSNSQQCQLCFWLLVTQHSNKNQAQPTGKPTQTQSPSHLQSSRLSNTDAWYWCWWIKHLRLPIRDWERGWISYLTIDSNSNLSSQSVFCYFCPLSGDKTVSLWLQTLFVIWRLMWGETEGMKREERSPSHGFESRVCN